MKKQWEKLLLERTNIRCAMWAAGLISEEQLDTIIINHNKSALILETGKSEQLYDVNFHEYIEVTFIRMKNVIQGFEFSNKDLVERYLK